MTDTGSRSRPLLISMAGASPRASTAVAYGSRQGQETLGFLLTVLTGQGAALDAAMTYAALVDRHIIGSGLQEADEARISQLHGLGDTATFLAAIAPIRDLAAADGRYPHLTNWLTHPAGPSPDEQFDLGLAFLLDGIATRL